MILEAFGLRLSWRELARRTASEVLADNCWASLRSPLTISFSLFPFPALLFIAAIISFIPVN
jgi:hypothetical protein